MTAGDFTCLPFGSGRALDARHAGYPGEADFARRSSLPEESLQTCKHRVPALNRAGPASPRPVPHPCFCCERAADSSSILL